MPDKKDVAKELDRIFKERGYGFRFEHLYSGEIPFSQTPPGLRRALNDFFAENHTAISDYMDYRKVNLPSEPNDLDAEAYFKNERLYNQSRENLNVLRDMQRSAMYQSFQGQQRQVVDPIRGYQFEPFNAPEGGTVVNNRHASQTDLIGYYGTPWSRKGNFNKGLPAETAKEIVSGNLRTVPARNGEIKVQGSPIWRAVDKVSASPYSGHSVNAQKYIEEFIKFNDRITKSDRATAHNAFFTADIETFGSMADGKKLKQDEWFHVNEIAVQKYKYDKTSGGHRAADTYSWLVSPNQKLEAEMRAQIDELRRNPHQFQALSEARQRSLLDLVKYSSQRLDPTTVKNLETASDVAFSGATYRTEGDQRFVIHSNTLDAFTRDGKIDPLTVARNFGVLSQHMESGLEALKTHGIAQNEAIGFYNNLVERHKTNYFLTYNGDKFDIPGLQKVGGVAPRKHLDLLGVVRSVFDSPMEMRRALNPDAPDSYKEGAWSLQELRRTFGLNTELAHIGLHDVGDEGLGGVVLRSRETLLNRIRGAQTEASGDGLQRSSSSLKYDPSPVKKGDLFFSTGALMNYSNDGSIRDFQAHVDSKGNVIDMDPSGRVFDSETFYSVLDLKERKDSGEYILRLQNENTGAVSHIVRGGENARHEIAQILQQNLKTANDMIEEGFDAIRSAKNSDIDRRRYENLLGLNQGYTRGYDAAKRIFRNAQIIRDNYEGDLSNIPENERRRLLNLDGVNFNSTIDRTFNQREADTFWRMLPRLASEADAFQTAFGEIDKAFPATGNMDREAQGRLNLNRSMALRRFSAELDMAAGGGNMEARKPLPYERYIMSFQDRITNQERRINLRDAQSAKDGVLKYIYAENGEYDGDKETQDKVARERLKTLVLSLQESNRISTKDARNLTATITENPSVSPAVYGEDLAAALAENQNLLQRIEQEEIVYRSMREADAVKNLETARVMTAATNAVGFASGIAGRQNVGTVRGREIYFPIITDSMQAFFNSIDRVDEFTGLRTNNQRAVMSVLERFMSQGTLSSRAGFALSAEKDKSIVHIDIFGNDRMSQVLGSLESGDLGTPNGAVRVSIPMISENGTMKYEGMVVNAKSFLVNGPDGIEKISSVQRLADEFTDDRVRTILRGAVDTDNADLAQRISTRATYNGVQMLAGTKRNVGQGENDTMFFRNNKSDITKQGYIDIAPAMIHDYYQSGRFDELGGVNQYLNDSAFEQDGTLKKYLDYEEDISIKAKELISREGMTWAENHLDTIGGPVDLSGVKDDKAWNNLSTVQLRDALPFGNRGTHTRSNLVQKMSSYDFSAEMQETFNARMSNVSDENRAFYSFDNLLTTESARQMESRLPAGSVSDINLKTALMTEADFQDRLYRMSMDEEGLRILQGEGIVDVDDAGNVQWNPDRTPTLYEQQSVMNREVLANMWVERQKFYDIDHEKNFRVASELIDEGTGRLREGAIIKGGQVIGYDHNGKPIVFDSARSGIISSSDQGRVQVAYKEQAHKFVHDIEKTTPSAGRGYGLRFMEFITGISGVGAILNPDIEKHGDVHHVLSGHVRRVAQRINELEGDERSQLIRAVEEEFRGKNGELGLRVVEQDGKYSIYEDTVRAGFTGDISSNVSNILRAAGLEETAETTIAGRTYRTTELQQAVSIADVPNYSKAVGDDGRDVKYGSRELDMLRRQGLGRTADYINAQIAEYASTPEWDGAVTAEQTRQGMMDSLRGMAGQINPEQERVFSVDDFEDLPIADRNRATYARTILDTDYIKKEAVHIPGSNREGFWFQLPDFNSEEVGKLGLRPITVDGNQVNQLFIPYENLRGTGNNVWKTRMQELNEQIFRRAKAVEDAKRPNEDGIVNVEAVQSARNRLQETVNEFRNQVVFDLTSSEGHVGQNVLSAKLTNSADGIAKITSPEFTMNPNLADQVEDNVLYISRQDAKAMGIFERLQTGEDFFAPTLRNPTFHEDAIQIAKVKVSDNLRAGEQQISSMMASYLRADSDGDSIRSVMLDNEGVQEELAQKWRTQNEDHLRQLQRMDDAFNGAVNSAVGSLYEMEKDHRGYAESRRSAGESWRDFSLDSLDTSHVDPNNANVRMDEQMAKFGRNLVGMASNLNYRYSHLSMQYLDVSNPEEQKMADAISNFFSGRQGLEQKIISAKHGSDGAVQLSIRHGGLQLIEALQFRQFDQALAIDRQYLGGQFTGKANMEHAIAGLKLINERADFRGNISKDLGLAGGIRPEKATVGEVLQVVEGGAENVSHANQFYARTVELNGGDPQNGFVYTGQPESLERPLEAPQRPEYIESRINPPEPEMPTRFHATGAPIVEPDIPVYEDRGLGRISSAFPHFGTVGKAALGIGAVGAGALMLTNLTKADQLKPEDASYNDPVIQDSQMEQTAEMPGLLDSQGNIRVEMNGEGYAGVNVKIRGQGNGMYGAEQIGNIAGGALTSAGIQANLNIRTQDDTTTITNQWLQGRFADLIANGHVEG